MQNTSRPAPAPTADFSFIRYAQVWEDADVLVRALALKPGADVLSIASAGDNAFGILTARPGRVVALDMNPAQLACAALRKAAYTELEHAEFLDLLGGRECPPERRETLYQRCRPLLPTEHRAFWDAQPALIREGAARVGKFERYFEKFRKIILPLVESRKDVETLLSGLPRAERETFYERRWNNWRWQNLFRVFFSRRVMGAMGRDPSFFKYVQGPVADRILSRTRYALTELNPAENPYLQWILTGWHRTALPLAWRPEHYETIREQVDKVELVQASIGDWLRDNPGANLGGHNLSDLFEYLSENDFHQLLELLLAASRPGARLVYWNMLAPRGRPDHLAPRLVPQTELANRLFAEDKAFFYSKLVIEEVSSG
jgi:S-adenosylmethionine-diacylglycerol 3-amino-3-carboxypropyl transferase